MFFVSENGSKYRITSHPSIFTDRNNANRQLHDIVLQRQSRGRGVEGGAECEDGNLYVTVAVWAKEDLATIRNHERLPPEITESMLYQWGLTDVQPPTESCASPSP